MTAFEFSVETEDVTDAGMVVLKGRAFRAGEYPDKKVSITPKQLLAMARNFDRSLLMNLEHQTMPPSLDGRVGAMTSVWVDGEDPTSLYARAEKPAWLHAIMPETKVSVEFTVPSSEDADVALQGCAWTSTPRVEDAQLVAAFSAFEESADAAEEAIVTFARPRHTTRSGQASLQAMHDTAARAGAVCQPPGKAAMASRHEASAIQQMHDLATAHGALCEGAAGEAGMDLQPRFFTKRRTPRMNLSDGLKAMFTQAHKDGILSEEVQVDDALFAAPDTSKVEELEARFAADAEARTKKDAEIESLRDEVRRQSALRLQSEAVHFADAQIRADKALPPEREHLIALYVQAATDDGATKAATFSTENMNRVQALEHLYEARPSLGNLITQLDPKQKTDILANFTVSQPTENGVSDERRKALLALSNGGRAVLEQADKK